MVLVFGTICIDRIRLVPELPPSGGYMEVDEELFLLGGEAANTANALHSWRARTILCGNSVGVGHENGVLQRLLDEKSLAIADIRQENSHPPTPVCDIYVTPDGERTMFGIGFATMEVGVDVARVPYQEGTWFTAEPNMVRASADAARLAQARGMRPYLMDFRGEHMLEGSDVFWQCSTGQVGFRGNTQKNVEWVKDWVARYGCFAILSDGPNGFVAGSPHHPVRAYPPYPAPALVDTTGAGDIFRAGMLYGLSQGWEIGKCLRFASAAGCLKCRAIGATVDVPTVAEIEAHIAQHGPVTQQYA